MNDTTEITSEELDARYRKAARRQWQQDGEIEVDQNATVSISSDGGAYVQAWIWVSNEEAGLPEEFDDEEERT